MLKASNPDGKGDWVSSRPCRSCSLQVTHVSFSNTPGRRVQSSVDRFLDSRLPSDKVIWLLESE